ncbi:MAG: hypothetical protein LBP27_02785 [Treponema sp.]|nr:hypothetical protein [Treponema sp.]
MNLKWSAIAGCAGLVLSLLVGVASGAGFPWLLFRALIFGAFFFVFGSGAWVLINNFVPELLFPESPEEAQMGIDDSPPSPGSRVNITLDDSQAPAGVSALPEMFRTSGDGDEVGDIAELFSAAVRPGAGQGADPGSPPAFSSGIDQRSGDGYNKNMGVAPSDEGAGNSFSAEAYAAGRGDPGNGEMSGIREESAGGLPDLEAVAGSFFNPAGAGEDNTGSGGELTGISPLPKEKPKPVRGTGGKAQPLKGDFNPQDLAAGIRTVLNKD